MKYTEKELVAFGNFILSGQRKENIINEENLTQVTDADLQNFKETANNKQRNFEQMESASTYKNDPFMIITREFRDWQKQWDAYDKGDVLIKPGAVDTFIEKLKESFEIKLK